MKKNIFILVLIVIFKVLCSCKQERINSNSNNKIIKLDVSVNVNFTTDYRNIFSDFDTIELQTTADCLIGQITSLRIEGSDIFITHQISSLSQLLRFSKSGQFLNRIGNPGRGPKEIFNPRGFHVEDSTLEVWSQLEMSLFSKDGDYIKPVFKKFYPGVGFFKANGNFFLFHSAAKPYMVSEVKSDGTILNQFNQNKFIDALSENDKVLFYDNQISLFCSVFDTIYGFSNNKIIPKAYFNFIDMKSVYEALTESSNADDFLNKINTQNLYGSIHDYFENPIFILFAFYHSRTKYFCLYNKKNDKSIYFKSDIIDQVTGSRYCSPVYLSDDNFLVIPVYNFQAQKKANVSSLNPSLSITNNNPILLYCKLISEQQ